MGSLESLQTEGTAQLLKEIVEHMEEQDGLEMSSWEISFIENVRYETKFSANQEHKIEQIYEKLVTKGVM